MQGHVDGPIRLTKGIDLLNYGILVIEINNQNIIDVTQVYTKSEALCEQSGVVTLEFQKFRSC